MPKGSRGPALALGVLGVALLVVIVAISLGTSGQRPVAASPTATPTATLTATASPAPIASFAVPPGCQVIYQQGDVPIVAPRTSGQFLQVALDRVVVIEPLQRTRWAVRFFVPNNAPGSAEIPLQASITDAQGRSVPVFPEYQAGPPNAGSGPVNAPLMLSRCGVVVLIIQSAPITSGRYTLALGPAKLPEGGTRGETFEVALTCDTRPAPVGGVCR